MFCALGTALPATSQQPPVKVNVLNVCTPSPDDQKEIAAASVEQAGRWSSQDVL